MDVLGSRRAHAVPETSVVWRCLRMAPTLLSTVGMKKKTAKHTLPRKLVVKRSALRPLDLRLLGDVHGGAKIMRRARS